MDPDPRGTGLLEARLKAEPASSHSPPALCADGGQGAEGRICAEAPGSAARTGLTPVQPGVHSADINGLGVSFPGGDRWNAAVLLRCAASVRL